MRSLGRNKNEVSSRLCNLKVGVMSILMLFVIGLCNTLTERNLCVLNKTTCLQFQSFKLFSQGV